MCIEGLCLSDGETQFCSSYCEGAQDCPNGDACVNIGNDEGACLPGSADPLEGEGNQDSDDTDDLYEDGPQIEDNIGCVNHSSQPLANHLVFILLLLAGIKAIRARDQELPSA